MQRELIWPEGALDAWQVKDKAFMERRKAEWEIIQQYLRLYKNVRSTNFRYHKQLFMKGRINYPDSFNFGVEPSLFYQMWYYPKNDLELFKKLFFLNLESADRLEIPSSRRQYVAWLRSQAAHAVSGDMCLPGYGLFGGKEENMFRALYPDYDFNNKVQPNFNQGKVEKISLGPSLGLIIEHITSAYGPLYYGSS